MAKTSSALPEYFSLQMGESGFASTSSAVTGKALPARRTVPLTKWLTPNSRASVSFDVRDTWMIFLHTEWRFFDSLRNDPRFTEMVERVGAR